jgi:hypothetical protein
MSNNKLKAQLHSPFHTHLITAKLMLINEIQHSMLNKREYQVTNSLIICNSTVIIYQSTQCHIQKT